VPDRRGPSDPEVAALDALDECRAELPQRATEGGRFFVWRAQVRTVRSISVQAGRTDSSTTSRSAGQGLQVLREDGRMAFAARDEFRPEGTRMLIARVSRMAESGEGLGLEVVRAPVLPPTLARTVPPECAAYSLLSLPKVARRLAEIERELKPRAFGSSLRLDYSADLDAWRVVRSDGSDVLFAMPRTVLRITAKASTGETPHRVGVSASAPDPLLPWRGEEVSRLLRRAESAARLAASLGEAPYHPAGSFPLVLDYALAKGLAHEAFGHASEADGYRSSVLARDGRFREGATVGPAHVSIVDEPVAGDHAWQPFSANGVPRQPAVLVDHGVLREGLLDPWSAAAEGRSPTDAARAESFRDVPLPRMTNIRIEADAPLPAPGTFEDYGPEEVRGLLAGAGVFSRHRKLAFLSGYSGGQVNPATGDFVFHCKAIYSLTRDRVVLHRPAVFSGSMFDALGAIREAFGPLRLDAIGTCGKWGQRVPSSGGSHFFLVLDPTPSVRLGGSTG
jgi:TldD protein